MTTGETVEYETQRIGREKVDKNLALYHLGYFLLFDFTNCIEPSIMTESFLHDHHYCGNSL